MGKYNKATVKEVTVAVPMLKCDFCGNEAVNEGMFGLTRTWGEVSIITPCGCSNVKIICPDCIRDRLTRGTKNDSV